MGASDVTVKVVRQSIREIRGLRRAGHVRIAAEALLHRDCLVKKMPPAWDLPETLNGEADRHKWPDLIHEHYRVKFSAPEVAGADLN